MPTHNARTRREKLARARQMYERYEQGETYQAIADDEELTRQRVWQLVRDYRRYLVANPEQDISDTQAALGESTQAS